jgi:hypothetical protein
MENSSDLLSKILSEPMIPEVRVGTPQGAMRLLSVGVENPYAAVSYVLIYNERHRKVGLAVTLYLFHS